MLIANCCMNNMNLIFIFPDSICSPHFSHNSYSACNVWISGRYQYLLVCMYVHRLHVSWYNLSKDITLDSQNIISEPKFGTLSNGTAMISKLLQEIQ